MPVVRKLNKESEEVREEFYRATIIFLKDVNKHQNQNINTKNLSTWH